MWISGGKKLSLAGSFKTDLHRREVVKTCKTCCTQSTWSNSSQSPASGRHAGVDGNFAPLQDQRFSGAITIPDLPMSATVAHAVSYGQRPNHNRVGNLSQSVTLWRSAVLWRGRPMGNLPAQQRVTVRVVTRVAAGDLFRQVAVGCRKTMQIPVRRRGLLCVEVFEKR